MVNPIQTNKARAHSDKRNNEIKIKTKLSILALLFRPSARCLCIDINKLYSSGAGGIEIKWNEKKLINKALPFILSAM